jgi:NAD+ synthase
MDAYLPTVLEGSCMDLRFGADELEAQRAHIEAFIADTVARAGADGAVLGLSGGVDSSLTAHLAVSALGADRLHGLVLPSTVNRDDNMGDAEAVAQDLGIEYDVVEIEPFVDVLLDAFPEVEDDYEAVGNARARTRGVVNYLVANHENRVVLGTGNRTEAMVGYFTKYGDQAVDCNPIGNCYKRQVRQLASHAGVPERIVEKPATAGLWPDQTDEDELGMDYATLDGVLALHVDGPLSTAATVEALDVSRDVVERVDELVAASGHKRSMPPAPERLSL